MLELSIVIAVISLLIVTTLAAQKILLSAKINNVVSSTNRINTSVGVFVSTYEKFPGDFNRATSYWPDTGIIDGDDDGYIEVENYESTNALLHLSASGTLQTQDWDGSSLYQAYIMDSYKEGGAMIISSLDNAGVVRTGFEYATKEGNYVKIGAGTEYDDEIFSPREQYFIDLKIDDGNAQTGRLLQKVSNTESANCTDSDGIYNLSSEDVNCLFIFYLDTLAYEG